MKRKEMNKVEQKSTKHSWKHGCMITWAYIHTHMHTHTQNAYLYVHDNIYINKCFWDNSKCEIFTDTKQKLNKIKTTYQIFTIKWSSNYLQLKTLQQLATNCVTWRRQKCLKHMQLHIRIWNEKTSIPNLKSFA